MANVELIDYTGKGRPDEMWHAANMLIFTKSTRLHMTADLMKKVQNLSISEKIDELNYMVTTIPSSWEFVDVTFLIKDVSRACAQQITRTRTASFAMQSQRAVDVTDAPIVNPFPNDIENEEKYLAFEEASFMATQSYCSLVNAGAEKQDARGILPMNICCNLVAKYNLRSLVDLVTSRKSLRTQGEYRDIVLQMEAAVKEAWPWSKPFFESKLDAAITLLESAAQEAEINVGNGVGWKIAKAADLIRKVK